MKLRPTLAGTCLSAALLAACSGNGTSAITPNTAASTASSQGLRSPAQSVGSSPHAGATLVYLHNFAGGAGDGSYPVGRLLYLDGTLYGTTLHGGSSNLGTVFSIAPSGSEAVLHSFSGEPDGKTPYGGLTVLDGTMYGTTYNGGDGAGTVYSITPAGAENVIYRFSNGSDGGHPTSGVVVAGGKLYGTTSQGGLYDGGTVYSMSTSGVESVLHGFGLSGDGFDAESELIHMRGILYGTTVGGGKHEHGTTFAVARKSGQETLLHSFSGAPDGDGPTLGRLLPLNGRLYGTTRLGGKDDNGIVYSVVATASDTYAVLHRFKGGADGCHPNGGLVRFKGLLYGTTTECGTYRHGTLFSLDPNSNTLTTLWEFGGESSGASPYDNLIIAGNALYGTTTNSGAFGKGAVFSFTP